MAPSVPCQNEPALAALLEGFHPFENMFENMFEPVSNSQLL